mmetsp:Transcript_38186/g.80062  ORF Transcript_38186/g.80062 Transcript_38186/m.80062 type:complete len:207 (-) Transcript_38186:1401-2021(-)
MHPILVIHLRLAPRKGQKAPLVHERRVLAQDLPHDRHPRRLPRIGQERKGVRVEEVEFHVVATPSAFAQYVESVGEFVVEGAGLDGAHDLFVVVDAGGVASVDLVFVEAVVGGGREGWRGFRGEGAFHDGVSLWGGFVFVVEFGFGGCIRFHGRYDFCKVVIAGSDGGRSWFGFIGRNLAIRFGVSTTSSRNVCFDVFHLLVYGCI